MMISRKLNALVSALMLAVLPVTARADLFSGAETLATTIKTGLTGPLATTVATVVIVIIGYLCWAAKRMVISYVFFFLAAVWLIFGAENIVNTIKSAMGG